MRQDKNSKTIITPLGKLLLFGLLVFLAVILLYITCSLKSVMIIGSTHYSEDELKQELLTSKTDSNTILFYLRLMYGKKEPIPFVEKVTATLVDRHTIKLHVYEKSVIGCIQYMGSYMYFDKDGIVVETSQEKLEGVPFITGLNFNSFILHDKMETENPELFPVILKITQLIQKFELDINTIQFNEDYEVTLKSGQSIVLLGKRDSYDEQIANLKGLLPTVPQKNGKILSIDLKNYMEGQEKIVAKPVK